MKHVDETLRQKRKSAKGKEKSALSSGEEIELAASAWETSSRGERRKGGAMSGVNPMENPLLFPEGGVFLGREEEKRRSSRGPTEGEDRKRKNNRTRSA